MLQNKSDEHKDRENYTFDCYYDQYQKKCVLDICTNIENEKDIYINDISPMETKEWTINPNTELVFHLQNDKYNYY